MNCRPGDLAWVVKAKYSHELLGHIVEVIGPFPRETTDDNGVFAWEVRYPDGRLILHSYDHGRIKSYAKTRAFGDDCLRPIRPGDLHETTDERKEVTA